LYRRKKKKDEEEKKEDEEAQVQDKDQQEQVVESPPVVEQWSFTDNPAVVGAGGVAKQTTFVEEPVALEEEVRYAHLPVKVAVPKPAGRRVSLSPGGTTAAGASGVSAGYNSPKSVKEFIVASTKGGEAGVAGVDEEEKVIDYDDVGVGMSSVYDDIGGVNTVDSKGNRKLISFDKHNQAVASADGLYDVYAYDGFITGTGNKGFKAFDVSGKAIAGLKLSDIYDEEGNVAGFGYKGVKCYSKDGEELPFRMSDIYDSDGNVLGFGRKGRRCFDKNKTELPFKLDELYDEDGNVIGHGTKGLRVYTKYGEEIPFRMNEIFDKDGNVLGTKTKGNRAYDAQGREFMFTLDSIYDEGNGNSSL